MKFIQLTQNKQAVVDDEDYDRLSGSSWCYTNTGYAASKRGGTFTLMHRLVVNAPSDKCVDHINGNRLDNRKDNLRLCSEVENHWNRRGYRNSTRRFKGVEQRKHRWLAFISANKKTTYLGTYPTEDDAACAYNFAAMCLYGEYAKLNPVEKQRL